MFYDFSIIQYTSTREAPEVMLSESDGGAIGDLYCGIHDSGAPVGAVQHLNDCGRERESSSQA